MDFQEAIQAMKEGKKVRRAEDIRDSNYIFYMCDKQIKTHGKKLLLLDDVEATDWELVENQIKLSVDDLDVISNLLDLDIQAMNKHGDDDTAAQLKIVEAVRDKVDALIKSMKGD